MTTKKKHLAMMGVAGSGKTDVGSAVAKELSLGFEDGDKYHDPGNVDLMSRGIPLGDEHRWPWFDRMNSMLKEQHEIHGKNVILACSALKGAYRDRLSKGIDLQWIYLKVSYELAFRRLTNRQGHYMKANLLESQFAALEEPNGDTIIIEDTGLPIDVVAGKIIHRLKELEVV